MKEKIYIDTAELAADYPARMGYREMAPGDRRVEGGWDTGRLLATIEAAKNTSVGDSAVVYSGMLAPCWVVAAVEHTLAPCESYFVTAYLGDLEIKLHSFPIGEQGNESGIEFVVIEDGDNIHIKLIADVEEIPRKGHNYDYSNFHKIVAPPIPEGKNVHIVAEGATYIVLCAEKTYAPYAKSVSISFAGDTEIDEDGVTHRLYHCCYTTPGGKALGEPTRMYRDWDIPVPVPPFRWLDDK